MMFKSQEVMGSLLISFLALELKNLKGGQICPPPPGIGLRANLSTTFIKGYAKAFIFLSQKIQKRVYCLTLFRAGGGEFAHP